MTACGIHLLSRSIHLEGSLFGQLPVFVSVIGDEWRVNKEGGKRNERQWTTGDRGMLLPLWVPAWGEIIVLPTEILNGTVELD